MNQKTKITVSGILTDLENGLTRTTNGKNYNNDIGCIQAKYDLTSYDLDMLFKHPKLKGKKTKSVRTISFTLEDDTNNTVPVVDETADVIVPSHRNIEVEEMEQALTEAEEETTANKETSIDKGWD